MTVFRGSLGIFLPRFLLSYTNVAGQSDSPGQAVPCILPVMQFIQHSADREMNIFIVEDSSAVRERLVDLVAEVPGVQMVGDAGNYDDAVSGILSTRPDVAILDIKLANGRGSGIDVLQRVKSELPRLRAIMLSNYSTPQHLKASADAGAEYFLDKSADFERIAGILGQLQKESEAG